MIGSFAEGQTYQFYAGLTAQILELVRQSDRSKPGALRYSGMDFSHAFEAFLYFATVHDEALNAMQAGDGAKNHPPLSGDVAAWLARHWFGDTCTAPFLRPEGMGRAGLRAVKRALNWRLAFSAARPIAAEGNLPARCDVLFYARSRRFADYLAPVAECFPGRHAFLLPAENRDVQQAMVESQKPFITAAAPGVRWRPAGSLIGRHAPHLAFLADGVETALRLTRPGVVVLAEGNSPDDEVVNQVGKMLGIPVVAIQQGWSPIVHPGFCNLSYEAMLVWGDGFGELLAPRNPRQRFIPTGNYVLQSAFRPPAERPPGVLFFHQDMDRGLSGRRGSEMMIALAEDIARRQQQIPVYYRPHPLMPLDNEARDRLKRHPNIVIQPPRDCPLAEALDKVRVTVSIYSTTILESVAAGAVPLIFNMTTMPHFWPDVAATGAGIEVRTLEAAAHTLERLLTDDQFLSSHTLQMKAFSMRFFCARGSQALDSVVRALEQIAVQSHGRTNDLREAI